MSALKALQGSETETRELLGGTEENSVPTKGSLICPPSKSMIFHKEETEKNELVAGDAAERLFPKSSLYFSDWSFW